MYLLVQGRQFAAPLRCRPPPPPASGVSGGGRYATVYHAFSDKDIKLFTLVDMEGNEIAEKEQLGLVLYRGGTVCSDQGYFSYTAADAICKEMNFTRAKRWTTQESFDIQNRYRINLCYVWCKSAEWESCSYSSYYYSRNCVHSKDVFLSCTSKYFMQ